MRGFIADGTTGLSFGSIGAGIDAAAGEQL